MNVRSPFFDRRLVILGAVLVSAVAYLVLREGRAPDPQPFAGAEAHSAPKSDAATNIPAALPGEARRLPTAAEGQITESGKFQSQGPQLSPAPANVEAMQAETGPAIREVNAEELQIGQTLLNKRLRTISFPAKVCCREQPLEYALVHESGKAHEALFTTGVPPQELHVGALLLNGVGLAPRIEVSWRRHGGAALVPLADLIRVRAEAGQDLLAQPWHYGGSKFGPGGFAAQREGSLISLVSDGSALISHPAAGALQRDDVFTANTAALPPAGVPVTLIFTFPNPP